ncbi:MAG: peptide ligase PGM1-related protein [Vicinamibacteria bacterium]
MPPTRWALDPAAQEAAFRGLKQRLEGLWSTLFPGDDEHYTSVVVPSRPVGPGEWGADYEEERLLFLLIRLRNPRARMIYVTSRPIPPPVLDYYCELLRGTPASHVRSHLQIFAVHDTTPRPLAAKILERPRLIARIRGAIFDPGRAYLTVSESSPLERTLALALDLPLNAADPALSHHATAAGARRVFDLAGLDVAGAGVDGDASVASAELRINPRREIVPVSTHEHLPDGGLWFPASPAYRRELLARGRRAAEVLAACGVVSRVSVTFAVRAGARGPHLRALGLDLGMGPVVHPVLALRFLTGGAFDADTGTFLTPSGASKSYRSSDAVGRGRYRGLLPEDLIDIAAAHHLRFDPRSESGVLFHAIGGLSERGCLGLTAVGSDRGEAERHHAHAVEVLDREASSTVL